MQQFRSVRRRWAGVAGAAGLAVLIAAALLGDPIADLAMAALLVVIAAALHLGWGAEEQRAERDLRAAHRRLQDFLDTLPDAAWMKDLDGRYLAVNVPFTARVGLGSGQILGRTTHDLFPREIADRLRANDRATMESGDRMVMEQRDPTAPDEELWVETITAPLRDPEGAVVGVVGMAHDVTHRRHATESAEETLALLRESLDATADGFLVIGRDGRVVSFNRKLTELSGLPPEALREAKLDRLTEWMLERIEDPEDFLALMADLEANPEAEARDEFRLQDGRVFERYTRPHRVSGRIAGRVWSFREVTSERAALQALHRREQQLAYAQRIARLGSFDWDIRSNEVAASEELWRVVGYEPGELPWSFEQFMEHVHPDDREVAQAAVEGSVISGHPLHCDVRVIRQDGAVRRVTTAGHAVCGADGRPERLIGTVQDVTARWEAAAGLERRIRVEQSLTQISQLLSEGARIDVGSVLRILGEALGASRTYLLHGRPDCICFWLDRAEEWCSEGVAPAAWLRAEPGDEGALCWWTRQLNAHEGIVVADVGELPDEARLERELLRANGVSSVAAVPIRNLPDGLNGALGIDYCATDSRASDEDLSALRTAAEMLVAHFARERAEREIAYRDAILQAVSFMAERFLLPSEWQRDLDDALACIGSAAGASRAYLFDNELDADGEMRVRQRAEWVAAGIAPQIDNSELQQVRLRDHGLQHWEDTLRANEPVQELVRNLSSVGRAHLEGQEIKSVLLIPIFVGGTWWGFLGFDDCMTEREWSGTEREALMAAGRMIGAGIQRQRAEEALRESELRFTQLSDNIPEVFFMAPVDMSEVLYLSPAFERVWGRGLDEAYAKPTLILDTILPEDVPLLVADMELSRRGGGDPMRFVDYRIVRPDGSIRWIRNRVFQIPDEQGQPYRVAGVCTDITDQKQLEEDLRRANRIEAIGHLAAGIAHEINTPIQYVGDNLRFLDESFSGLDAALAAYAALLEEARGGAVTPERIAAVAEAVETADVEYLLREAPRASAQALDGVQRVAEIVRAMKEFSHPGSGTKMPTDLNQAIRSTVTVARSEWKYVAELVTELDESLPAVHCLPGELNQAILNLVINAAHAIADRQQAEGSDIPGVITVSTAVAGDAVLIRVRDTGTGIPAEIRARIFDPFFTTKEVGRGTGQGLTFVHAIVVDKHGGTVGFETEPGVGTTFTVRLPQTAVESGMGVAA